MTLVQDTDGVDWRLETFDLARDLIRLRYVARSGDRIATAAVVALASTATAMEAGQRPMCAGCNFRFGGFRRPAGVVGAIKCDVADAPLAGALCHYCLAARPPADLLDALIDQVDAQAGGMR
jgi:hypothetical protein